MGNGKLCPDAVKAPISALQRVIHVFNQVLAPGILRVCPFHPKILSAFAYFQMRSVEFLPVGILISHSKTLPVFFRAIRMVSQTLQSISFLSEQKLLKNIISFLPSSLPFSLFLIFHLYTTSLVLFSITFKPWHNIAQQHKDTARMHFSKKLFFRTASYSLPGMWFHQQQCKLCHKETAGTWLTNFPPAWGRSGGLTMQFCLVCWECRFISHNCLIMRIGWVYRPKHNSLTSLSSDATERRFLSDAENLQESEDTTKPLWLPGCGKGGRWHLSVE